MGPENQPAGGTTPTPEPVSPPSQPAAKPVTPEAIGAVSDPWAGLEPQHRPLVAAKKWETGADAVRGYAAAEKLLGKPADELVHVPKAGMTPEMRRELAARVLGRPDEPSAYDFGEIKDQEGAPPLIDWWRGVAHKLGLGQEEAKTVAEAWTQLGAEIESGQEAQMAERREQARAKLMAKHGDQFLVLQQQGARALAALGITDPSAEGSSELELMLEQAMEPDVFFETFASLGAKLGEHRIPEAPGQASLGPAAVQAEIDAILKDPKHPYWIKDHPGQKAAAERIHELHKKLHGDAPAWGAGNE